MAAMGLGHQFAEFRAEFGRTAPAGRPALYEAKIEELRSSFAMDKALGVGGEAPDFVLPDAHGHPISLSDILQHGPGGRDVLSRRLVPLLQSPASRLPGRVAGPDRARRAPRRDFA